MMGATGASGGGLLVVHDSCWRLVALRLGRVVAGLILPASMAPCRERSRRVASSLVGW
jgi:hypothetical protein